MSEPRTFNPLLVFGLIAAGIASFAAFIMLIAWGDGNAGAGRAGRATAVSVSAIGFKGLVDLTGRFRATALIRDDRELGTRDLVVVALERTNDADDVRALLRRRRGRPTILILPKWAVEADPRNGRWVRSRGPFGGGGGQLLGRDVRVESLSAERVADARVQTVQPLTGIRLRPPRAAQVIHGDRIIPVAGVRGEGALVGQLDEEPHFVVADPDLLNNLGMRNRESAQAAVQMLLALAPNERGPIRFDLTLNGVGGQRSLLRSMLEPPFLAMTLALLAAAILAGLHGAIRFGPANRPARAIPFGKAALVENSAGLVRLAGREVPLGAGYADLIRDDAARAAAAPTHLRGEALEAYLDRFSRGGEAPFSALARAVRSARDRADLAAAARALFAWKRNLVR